MRYSRILRQPHTHCHRPAVLVQHDRRERRDDAGIVVIGDGDGLRDVRGADAAGGRKGDGVGVVGRIGVLSGGDGDCLRGIPVGGGEVQGGRREGHIGVGFRKRYRHIRTRCSTELDREAAPCRIALVDR